MACLRGWWRVGYDIIALTETHDRGYLRPSKHFITGDAAPNGDPYAGVALLFSDRVAESVLHTGCCGPRIVYAAIRASPCNLFVVSVYVPHAGRQNPSPTDTLADLEALLVSVPQHDCVIVLGDFNAKLPRSNGRHTGRWCIHTRGNQAGDMLGSLMERRQLCAVSTLHQPRRHATNATYLSSPMTMLRLCPCPWHGALYGYGLCPWPWAMGHGSWVMAMPSSIILNHSLFRIDGIGDAS